MEVPIAVPPLPEQRAIAEALSDVDGLLGGLDRLIAKKRDLKQAAMQQLLTGQTRLPGFHGEWEVKQLGDVAISKRAVDNPTSARQTVDGQCHCYASLLASHHTATQTIGSDLQFPEARIARRASVSLHDGSI